MSDEKVWMEHPNLGPERKMECTRKQAAIWHKAGWRECDPPPPPEDPIEADRKAKADQKPAAKKKAATK